MESKDIVPEGEHFRFRPYFPENVGWLEISLSKDIIKYLWQLHETAKKKPVNVRNELAGQVKTSFLLNDENNYFMDKVLKGAAIEYEKIYGEYNQANVHAEQYEQYKYTLQRFWSNTQYETEFNPPHMHSAVYSFVIWLKIPTDWREQHKLYMSEGSGKPKASNFEFMYTNILGQSTIHSYKLDKTMEGRMLFFPGGLTHTVHPFYGTKEPRISLSGNLRLKRYERLEK